MSTNRALVLECPVCLRSYTDAGVDPVTFLCGHSLCMDDAKQLTQCPTCYAALPAVGAMTVNYSMKAMAEHFREMELALKGASIASQAKVNPAPAAEVVAAEPIAPVAAKKKNKRGQAAKRKALAAEQSIDKVAPEEVSNEAGEDKSAAEGAEPPTEPLVDSEPVTESAELVQPSPADAPGEDDEEAEEIVGQAAADENAGGTSNKTGKGKKKKRKAVTNKPAVPAAVSVSRANEDDWLNNSTALLDNRLTQYRDNLDGGGADHYDGLRTHTGAILRAPASSSVPAGRSTHTSSGEVVSSAGRPTLLLTLPQSVWTSVLADWLQDVNEWGIWEVAVSRRNRRICLAALSTLPMHRMDLNDHSYSDAYERALVNWILSRKLQVLELALAKDDRWDAMFDLSKLTYCRVYRSPEETRRIVARLTSVTSFGCTVDSIDFLPTAFLQRLTCLHVSPAGRSRRALQLIEDNCRQLKIFSTNSMLGGPILNVIKNNPGLEELALVDCTSVQLGGSPLETAASLCPRLTKLVYTSNTLIPSALEIAAFLRAMPGVRSIQVNRDVIFKRGHLTLEGHRSPDVAVLLRAVSGVDSMDLSKCDLSGEVMTVLAEHSVTRLRLVGIRTLTVPALGALLTTQSRLGELIVTEHTLKLDQEMAALLPDGFKIERIEMDGLTYGAIMVILTICRHLEECHFTLDPYAEIDQFEVRQVQQLSDAYRSQSTGDKLDIKIVTPVTGQRRVQQSLSYW